MLHFVGFRGEEYWSAVKVWGVPDFYHRFNDERVLFGGEMSVNDVAVYANNSEKTINKYVFNDSAVF